jgi:hypothetical protein
MRMNVLVFRLVPAAILAMAWNSLAWCGEIHDYEIHHLIKSGDLAGVYKLRA